MASDTDGCLLPGQWLQSAGCGHLPADGPRGTYPVCCYGDCRERGICRQLRAHPAHEPQPGPRSCRHQATTHSGNPKVHRWQDQLLQGTDLIEGFSVVVVVWMVVTLFNLYSFFPRVWLWSCGTSWMKEHLSTINAVWSSSTSSITWCLPLASVRTSSASSSCTAIRLVQWKHTRKVTAHTTSHGLQTHTNCHWNQCWSIFLHSENSAGGPCEVLCAVASDARFEHDQVFSFQSHIWQVGQPHRNGASIN